MKPPVRMVCGNCLGSVELTPDESGQLSKTCPICKGEFDEVLSDIGPSESQFTLALPGEFQHGSSTVWTDTWSKGSLGTIGRFTLRETLGDGGFGVVFHAYDPRLDRDVALKVLKHPDPSERVMQRFFREARAVARLSHPNIVSVYDAGTDGNSIWIAYAFVKGRPLSSYLESQTIDIPTAVQITVDLARALEHAHRHGIYHRDIKPANVVVDDQLNAYLIDFGLARRADLVSNLTNDGAILGTPSYMPPEQALGRSHIADARSDIFSLGVILYESLSGRRPSENFSDETSFRDPNFTPRPLKALNDKVPLALERICEKALAKDPSARFRDANEFARALERWLDTRRGLEMLRHPVANFGLGAAACLLLLVGFQLLLTPNPKSGILLAMFHPSIETRATQIGSIHPVDPAEPPVSNDIESPFIGSSETKRLHHSWCKAAKLTHAENRIPLTSLEQAHDLGFTRGCGSVQNPDARGRNGDSEQTGVIGRPRLRDARLDPSERSPDTSRTVVLKSC